MKTAFEWDEDKNQVNIEKHGVSFDEARQAFFDEERIIARDLKHSSGEERFFCIGKVDRGILTVRFTYIHKIIRIIGAGFWRKGRKVYESERRKS
jgi:uncharacterized DUF497 family protein